MTPQAFVSKWHGVKAKESASAKVHFEDLCTLLGVPGPLEEDPSGSFYTYEKHVRKATGKKGYADVWRRGCFGWEYKGKDAVNLREAYIQLLGYKDDLENPPLLVVCNLSSIEVHTQFIGVPKTVYTFSLDDLLESDQREQLKKVWTDPESLNPRARREEKTRGSFKQLEQVADILKGRLKYPADKAAHFLVKVVFTLFAEDEGLIPAKTFERLLEAAIGHSEDFRPMCEELFAKMNTGGVSLVGRIPYFNGGVFSDSEAPDLNLECLQLLVQTARADWSEADPAIFGSLFEGVIDPTRRSQLGAHYTPAPDILDVIEPVIIEPLKREWNAIRDEIQPVLESYYQSKASQTKTLFDTPLGVAERRVAKGKIEAFLERLSQIRVLDPACGSGNFLYLTQQRLLEFEAEVRAKLEPLNEGRPVPSRIHPRQFYGIDISEYSPEIANMVLWIGFIQARKALGETVVSGEIGKVGGVPILQDLGTLIHHDALLDDSSASGEYEWPEAEFIVGNPPFLGYYKMREELGDVYTEKVRKQFKGRVGGNADLVCYWFEKARVQLERGIAKSVGLIATNSIGQKQNRGVLENIKKAGNIFLAWPDRPWIQDGTAIRVSIVCFDNQARNTASVFSFEGDEWNLEHRTTLKTETIEIHADLSFGSALTHARPLLENRRKAFVGMMPAGAFDISQEQAQAWLDLPNPSGVSNSDVIKPYLTGEDIVQKAASRWIIDFDKIPLERAELYRKPFQHLEQTVKSIRLQNNRKARRDFWWVFAERMPTLREAIKPLSRYIATPRVAKHRVYGWLPKEAIPANALTVIAAEDDYTFGLLNSSIHTDWVTALGSSMGMGNDSQYTNHSFETFPFPKLSSEQEEAIARAARFLEQMRQFLKRPEGAKLTLTGMYNELEAWRSKGGGSEKYAGLEQLDEAHRTLDAAVAAAYGWTWPLEKEEVLSRLLALNLERAALEGGGVAVVPVGVESVLEEGETL